MDEWVGLGDGVHKHFWCTEVYNSECVIQPWENCKIVGCVEYSRVSEREVSFATESWEEISIKVEEKKKDLPLHVSEV